MAGLCIFHVPNCSNHRLMWSDERKTILSGSRQTHISSTLQGGGAIPEGCHEEVDIISQEVHIVCPVDYDEPERFGCFSGFPVAYNDSPASATIARRQARPTWSGNRPPPAEKGGTKRNTSTFTGPLEPKYHVSPFYAESKRNLEPGVKTARILILDEGNICRSVLTEGILYQILFEQAPTLLNSIEIASASIGDPNPGPHDPRVVRAAISSGFKLPKRQPMRRFQEVADAVNFDLILVMDNSDKTEVLRDLSILDKLNPRGHYTDRVQRLGRYSDAMPSVLSSMQLPVDIADPFLLDHSSESIGEVLERCIAQIEYSLHGLVRVLQQLDKNRGNLSLREALAQCLRCPLLGGTSINPRNVYDKGYASSSVTRVKAGVGQKYVRRYKGPWRYWSHMSNVEFEMLNWMKKHGFQYRLPTKEDLKRTGDHTLSYAIERLGGMSLLSEHMALPMSCRKPNGYWEAFENLQRELEEFVGAGEKIFPMHSDLVEHGRRDILKGLRKHGGSAAVAAKLGWRYSRKPPKATQGLDTLDYRMLQQEVLDFIQKNCHGACMPTMMMMQECGRGDLRKRIQKAGGHSVFAKKLGLKRCKGSACQLVYDDDADTDRKTGHDDDQVDVHRTEFILI